jgi:hypothetical protein
MKIDKNYNYNNQPSDNLSECFDVTMNNLISSGITFRRVHNNKPVFKIASIEQDGFFRWTIRPVRVRVVERGSGGASGKSAEGIREEDTAGGEGKSGERTETAKESDGGGGDGGGGG